MFMIQCLCFMFSKNVLVVLLINLFRFLQMYSVLWMCNLLSRKLLYRYENFEIIEVTVLFFFVFSVLISASIKSLGNEYNKNHGVCNCEKLKNQIHIFYLKLFKLQFLINGLN